MDTGLLLTLLAAIVAGIAAVVGLWVERDDARPKQWAYSLSILILMSAGVTIATSYVDSLAAAEAEKVATERFDLMRGKADAVEASNARLEKAAEESAAREEKTQEDVARMLVMLNKMAAENENPELAAFVDSEISAQSRSNDDVLTKVAERMEAAGGDSEALFARSLPPAERQAMRERRQERKERRAARAEKRGKTSDVVGGGKKGKQDAEELSKEERAERRAKRLEKQGDEGADAPAEQADKAKPGRKQEAKAGGPGADDGKGGGNKGGGNKADKKGGGNKGGGNKADKKGGKATE